MKNTISTFQKAKANKEKVTMLTAYDYSTAKLIDEAGIDSILVGDSLGNTMLGYEDTISVTMEDMIHHCACVARGAKNALVICDMPFIKVFKKDIVIYVETVSCVYMRPFGQKTKVEFMNKQGEISATIFDDGTIFQNGIFLDALEKLDIEIKRNGYGDE